MATASRPAPPSTTMATARGRLENHPCRSRRRRHRRRPVAARRHHCAAVHYHSRGARPWRARRRAVRRRGPRLCRPEKYSEPPRERGRPKAGRDADGRRRRAHTQGLNYHGLNQQERRTTRSRRGPARAEHTTSVFLACATRKRRTRTGRDRVLFSSARTHRRRITAQQRKLRRRATNGRLRGRTSGEQ